MYNDEYNENNRTEEMAGNDPVTGSESQQTNAGVEQSTDGSDSSQTYRYGRSYYETQQDSIYHTNPQHNSYSSQTGSSDYSSNTYSSGSSYTGNYSHYDTQTSGDVKEEPKKRKKFPAKKALKIAACIAVVAAVGAGSAFAALSVNHHDEDIVETTTVVGDHDSSQNNYKVSTVSASTAVVTDVSDVVEKTMPTLVKITNVGTQTYSTFFGQGGTYETESNGSGIIIGQTDEELLIVTNQHVVSGADKLKVIFIDEESCEANVKGTNAEKDLAVIAISLDSIKEETLNQIKVATLGDSDAVKVGEPAIAIGNALGYGQSVTLGVISAKNREVTTENSTNTLIQTDAAINPGNSGGALMNIAGEVIGINSVKYSSTEVEGMGYAIPISDATPIINELMNKETKKKVAEDQQSYLGISGVDITSDVAQTYNMPKGVYVADVVDDGPAEEAGIRKGDIITKIAGVSVTSFDELKAELEYHAAGTTVEVEILSQQKASYGYESKVVEVTLGKKEN